MQDRVAMALEQARGRSLEVACFLPVPILRTVAKLPLKLFCRLLQPLDDKNVAQTSVVAREASVPEG